MNLLWKCQGGLCPGCGEPIEPPRRWPNLRKPDKPSLDHVIPRSRGGSNAKANKLAMHMRCNSLKGDRMPTGCELIWLAAVTARLGCYEGRPA